MKNCIYKNLAALMVLSGGCVNGGFAQDGTNDRVESSIAILDTSIPFAIGAREGEQTIRGSFGWPTFQEGFVEGVYFRFDPDGYARFSKSPRLDEDVFEVICQAGSTNCVAKKNSLEIGVSDQGQPYLNIVGLTADDHFFLSDRKTELPLPQSVVGPLDQRLETLLSSGGDLIIRRELETLQTLSLSGFSATVTYLRWVGQNQSSFVFPRGWPTPSQQTGGQVNAQSTPQGSLLQRQGSRWSDLNVGGTPNGVQQVNVLAVSTQQPYAELPAVEFAQQAQGRSLTSDVNRFVQPSQEGGLGRNTFTANVENTPHDIGQELAQINATLRALDVKLNNMAHQMNDQSQYAGVQNTRSVSQGRLLDASNQIQPSGSIGKTDDEMLRETVIKNLLANAQKDAATTPPIPDVTNQGEVSVKKTIVERLLEELNGPETAQTATAPAEQEAPVTSEFISLSDYINKVLQEETQ